MGAQIELMSLRDTLDKKYALTAIRGAYQFKQVQAGKYRVIASSLGYVADTMEITVERGKDLVIPEWEVEMERHKIDEVSVVTQAIRTSINGDTISYNASAFKVLPDADADELLSKLPGLKVDGGTITTQGETVQKILVDGREFFGSDVSQAIKTLPAQIVKSVEVFDKLSDEAEFSGIDDGNSYKAINLVTKIKTAAFGKVNALYAMEPENADGIKHYGNSYYGGTLSSEFFSAGFAGSGWAIQANRTTGNVTATFDEVVARKKFRAYEFEVKKLSATNGSLWISDSCSGDSVEKIA